MMAPLLVMGAHIHGRTAGLSKRFCLGGTSLISFLPPPIHMGFSRYDGKHGWGQGPESQGSNVQVGSASGFFLGFKTVGHIGALAVSVQLDTSTCRRL